MKKRIILTLLLIMVAFIFVPFIPVLSFTETRTNSPITHYLSIKKEKDFQIIFTHTIHKTDVIENYRVVNSKEILLLSMEYSDVAIGMPSYAEEGQTLLYEDGQYTLSYERAVLPHFTLFIGNVEDQLFFQYHQKKYDLKERLEKGKSYLFEVKKLSLFEVMKGVNLDEQ